MISELKPDGYSIHHVSRQSQRGGGVAIVFNSDLKIEQISNEIQFTHFEKLECMISGENKKIHLHGGPTISETLCFSMNGQIFWFKLPSLPMNLS